MKASYLFILFACCLSSWAELPYSSYQIIATHPHDPNIFTQGLALKDGQLYQSSGLRGKSVTLVGPLGSRDVDASFHFPRQYFAEGLAVVGQEVFVLTWHAGEVFALDHRNLQLKRKLKYRGEGWGLAYDGEQLWLSDGSSRLRRYDAGTMELLGNIKVSDDSGAVRRINELEAVRGSLLANIWHSTRMIAIDPSSGRVIAQWDLAPLLPEQRNFSQESVANGIAFDPHTGHIWLTGKGWPSLYEIKLDGLPGN